MKVLASLLATLGASVALTGALVAQSTAPPVIREIERADLPGGIVFERQCAVCHGIGPGDDGSPMLPGTAALAAKYAGSKPGLLELRSDLPSPVLTFFLRRGSGAMPMFRKSELTDEQIEQIADYLNATSSMNAE